MLDTIYNDFTTKLLPQIQQGLVITKDYFMDLFGRYAKFLFVQDLLYTILCFLVVVISCVALYKFIKYGRKNDWDIEFLPIIIFFIIPIGFGIAGFVTYLTNTIKDKYVPEIRIMEEISNFKK